MTVTDQRAISGWAGNGTDYKLVLLAMNILAVADLDCR